MSAPPGAVPVQRSHLVTSQAVAPAANHPEIERPRWRYLLQIVSVVALLVAFLSLMSAAEAAEGSTGQKLFLLLRMAFLVVLCTWFLRREGERWRDLGLRRPRRWWLVPLLVVGGFIAVLELNQIIRALVLPAIDARPPQLGSDEAEAGNMAMFLFSLLVSWSSAAFGEELLLRGFLLDRIARVIGSFHFYQSLGGVLATGMVGPVMGLLWLVSGRNLWPCILLHSLVNTISAIESYTWTPG